MTEEKKLGFFDYFSFMLIPVLVILFSSILSLVLTPISRFYIGEIIPETDLGLAGDVFYALIFIIVAVFSAFIIYFIIEKEKDFILKYVLGFAIGFSCIVIMTLYCLTILNLLILSEALFQILFAVIFISSLLIGSIAGYVLISNRYKVKIRNSFMIFYSIIVSVFLALVLPSWTLIIILIGISIYDIYSVREGPIKKVIEITEERKDKDFVLNLTVSIGEWEIGIGDLVFYSLLVSHTVLYFGILPWIFSIIGLVIGLSITLVILIRKKLLPGLPIALGIGMIPMLILSIIPFLI